MRGEVGVNFFDVAASACSFAAADQQQDGTGQLCAYVCCGVVRWNVLARMGWDASPGYGRCARAMEMGEEKDGQEDEGRRSIGVERRNALLPALFPFAVR